MSTTPEPSRRLPRAVIVLGWVSFFTDASADMVYPLVPAFLVSLGGGATALGWLEGVAEAVSAAIKLWAGRAIDRTAHPKRLVVLGYGIAALARPLYALATAPVHAVLVRVADRVGKGLRGPPRDAMLAASVDAARRGHAFGFHRMMDNFGGVAGPLLAFLLMQIAALEVRTVFLLSVVPGLISVLLAHLFLKPPPPETAHELASKNEALREGASRNGAPRDTASKNEAPRDTASRNEAPRDTASRNEATREEVAADHTAKNDTATNEPAQEPPAASPAEPDRRAAGLGDLPWRFFLVTAVFTLAASGDLFLMRRLIDLGLHVKYVPVAWVSLQLLKGLFNVPGGRASDRHGRRRVLAVAWFLYAATYLSFGLVQSWWAAWLLVVPYALHYGLAEGGQRALLTDLAPRALRGRAYGVQLAIEGLFILPANVGFGMLFDRLGARTAFAAAAGCAALAAVLLVALVPDPKQR